MTVKLPVRAGRFAAGIAVILIAFVMRVEASVAWGSINNFDTVNDTGGECHGFEIEIEGIHSRDVTYTYDWNHYGVPKITEDNSNPARPRVFIRYAGVRNPNGTWSAYTAVPAGPILPTDGHQFTNPSVNFGGEHFGVGYYGAPTSIKYSWLKDDGLGNLVFSGAVNIATPTFNYFPPPAPAEPAKVVAAIVPPPPPELPVKQFGPASWVKETKTKSHNNNKVELRDLVSDDPDDPNDRNWKNGEPDEVEVEWKLLQTDFEADDGIGKNGELVGAPEELPEGDEVVTRRYDFFKYVGPFDAESGEAMADEVGPDGIHGVGSVTYNDHIDPATGEWVEVTTDLSTVVIVGDYIGAQMAGFDAGAQIGLIDHLQDGEIHIPYVDRTIVVGGTPPIVITRTGPLPAGMAFDEVTGILSGTPTETGTFTFDVHATDAKGGDVATTYHLTIASEPEPPHITVTTIASPPAGGSTLGNGEYLIGDTVTVRAMANPEFEFVNWTDGGTIVSLAEIFQFTASVNRELVANFIPVKYTITTGASPLAGGNTSGGGIFNSGDPVTVVAAANAGYSFVNWTEGGVIQSATASYSFVASANRNLVANFAKVPIPGDINNDEVVNAADLSLILAARNKPASGPNDPRDLDHDGKITVLDARIEILLINQSRSNYR